MKIIVLGAYGYTGTLICQELLKEKMDFAIGGRKQLSLNNLMEENNFSCITEIVEMNDSKCIDRITNDYDIFINCVGPFTETANLLIAGVAASGKCYIDITGEMKFVEESKNNYHQMASENKATILHSCAFESVLVNLLAHLVIDDSEKVKSILSFYNTGKSKASPGTKLTMKLAKYRNNYHYQNGEERSLKEVENIRLEKNEISELVAIPFALPEICFAQWNTSAQNIGSYLVADLYDASYIQGVPNEKIDISKKDMLIAKFDKRRPKGPSEEARLTQKFVIDVRVEDQKGVWREVTLQGVNYYLLSAQILVYIVKKYIKRERYSFGVISPIEFLGKNNSFFRDLNLIPDEK